MEKGFTLIETLAVIAIIGVLFGIVLINLANARKRAKIATAQLEIKQISNAISMLEVDTEQWPGHKTPFKVEVNASDNEICSDGCSYSLSDCRAGLICNPSPPNRYPNWQGPYMEEIPKDSWGNEYFFDTDYDIKQGSGEEWAAVLGSYGPDGRGNNLYNADDVIYVIFK